MFSFYGAKKSIIDCYPEPKLEVLVEPFAGSASYSVRYPHKYVHLYDLDHRIAAVWRYLTQASIRDICALPDIQPGDCLDDHGELAAPERYLLGFYANPGSSIPKKTATSRCAWTLNAKVRLAWLTTKIGHWKVTHGSYERCPEMVATWFVDPPYVKGGQHYSKGSKGIDYPALADWCRERQGQVIVCENEGADWLPFKPLAPMNGQRHRTLERVWTQSTTDTP